MEENIAIQTSIEVSSEKQDRLKLKEDLRVKLKESNTHLLLIES
jgi:hypothetical protein